MDQRLDFYKASPENFAALTALNQQLAASGLEKPLIELVRLRAGQINECSFCIDKHATDAAAGGESMRRLVNLMVWREAPFYSDRERAALEWTESVTDVAHAHVPDEVWIRVKPLFTPQELVYLTLLVGVMNAMNRIAIAFRKVPAQDG